MSPAARRMLLDLAQRLREMGEVAGSMAGLNDRLLMDLAREAFGSFESDLLVLAVEVRSMAQGLPASLGERRRHPRE